MEQPGQRKILIACDASETARNAFEWYMENVRKDNDYVFGVVVTEFEVSVFTAIKSAAGGDAVQVSKKFAEKFAENEKLTADYTAMLRAKSVKGQFDTYSDNRPAQVICKVADDHDVTAIVIGTRGLGSFKRAVLGSVSQQVILHSNRPVIVVPKRDLI